MFNKCIHNWKIITDNYEEAPVIKLSKRGIMATKISNLDFCMGTKLVILQCEKCGVLDKTIEKM